MGHEIVPFVIGSGAGGNCQQWVDHRVINIIQCRFDTAIETVEY